MIPANADIRDDAVRSAVLIAALGPTIFGSRPRPIWPDCPLNCSDDVHDCQCRGSDLDEREGVA